MKPFKQCPVCDGELMEKEVEKLLRGGINIATIEVPAEVCTGCGERLYSQETARLFEEIRKKLELHQVEKFRLLGKSFIIEKDLKIV